MLNRLQVQGGNIVVVWVYAWVLWGLVRNHLKLQPLGILPFLVGGVLALSIFLSIFHYLRLQKLSEAAISKIASAAQGYIELQGIASTDKPFKTPYQGIPCVWYSVSAYADEPVDAEKGDPRRLLEYLQSEQPFKLTDETGFCMVNPKGAEIVALTKSTYRKNNHRYEESYLPSNTKLHVIGHLDTRHNYLTSQAMNADIGKLLVELKANKPALLNKYDHNLDGEIDMDEWQQVRADVTRHVEANHAINTEVNFYTLAKPSGNKLFLISALSPSQMRNLLINWHRGHLFAAIIFGMAILKFI